MPSPAVTTRFAPSPTGVLHLGNLRTALFNALLARGSGGRFIFRVEDTDASRGEPGHEAAMLEDLHWLGLEWQEGPDVGGPHGPYRQSQRSDTYARYLQQLESTGAAYPCFCSAEELARAREAQRAAGEAPRYPGTCARLDPEAARERIEAGERPTLRLRVPRGRTLRFEDAVRGMHSFDTDDLGDFIIRRSDGRPAFLFANALDDALMGVTHVVRGEDHLANTTPQLLVLEALGLSAPHYAHLSLIVDAHGQPLSKRSESAGIRQLRDGGYRPAAVINHLARLGHSLDDQGLLDIDALAGRFSLGRVSRAPARHDPAHLDHWQHRAVEGLDTDRFWEWVCDAESPDGRRVVDLVPRDSVSQFVEVVRANVVRPSDAAEWAAIVFGDVVTPDSRAVAAIEDAGAEFFEAALDAQAGTLETVTTAIRGSLGVKGRALYQPLRAALTGRTAGPDLAGLWGLLAEERVRERLESARGRASL